jgi:hypothetical protein
MNRPKLSIVILSYNTVDLLRDCLNSLSKVTNEVESEVIVVDNGSADNTADMVNSEFPNIKLIRNKKNLGFAAGNNCARNYSRGEYVLFLNSDTIVNKGTVGETVKYLDEHRDVGALTCKLVMQDGNLDLDARRSFVTPWVGLTHIYLKLDWIFPKSRLFAKYWYGYLSPDIVHEVDVIQGAYFLVRKKVLNEVGWFDEDYFLDGEDIDLCWKIKQKDWKIIYYPKVSIIHIKGATKGKNKEHKYINFKEKMKYRMAGVNSMELFFRKRLWNRYPRIFDLFVLTGIKLLKGLRIVKLLVTQ